MLINDDMVKRMYAAGPTGIRTTQAFLQTCCWPSLDIDHQTGCIRNLAHAYSPDGGLAVLFGNLAENGCLVKTAAVDENCLTFRGLAKVFDSQEEAVTAILGGKIVAGDMVVIRYEGPRGGPGMQEMLYPTSYSQIYGVS